jgi:hypothetical protein
MSQVGVETFYRWRLGKDYTKKHTNNPHFNLTDPRDIPEIQSTVRLLDPHRKKSAFGAGLFSSLSILGQINYTDDYARCFIWSDKLTLYYNLYGLYIGLHEHANPILRGKNLFLTLESRLKEAFDKICDYHDLSRFNFSNLSKADLIFTLTYLLYMCRVLFNRRKFHRTMTEVCTIFDLSFYRKDPRLDILNLYQTDAILPYQSHDTAEETLAEVFKNAIAHAAARGDTETFGHKTLDLVDRFTQ